MDLITLCKELSPFVVGSEGNVSKNVGDGFIVKVSGTSLNDYHFIKCDFNGKVLGAKFAEPSMEAGFHAVIYRNSNFKVIAHTHPIKTTGILCSKFAEEFAEMRLFPDQVVFNDRRSELIEYVMPGKELEKAIESRSYALGYCPKIFLLKNHGIICCGNSEKEVLITTQICEKAAEIFIAANMSPISLTRKQIDEIIYDEKERYRSENIR